MRLLDEDRQLALALETPEAAHELLLQILPQRSNLYLLDAQRRVLAALRPLAETRPELALGEPWRAPASRAPSEGEDRFAGEPDERFLFAIESSLRRGRARGRARRAAPHARAGAAPRGEGARAQAREGRRGAGAGARGDASRARRRALEGRAQERAARRRARSWREIPRTDEEIVIALDPALSPAENLEQIFRRYRKAVRALAQGGARREAIVGALASVRARLRELAAIDALGEAASGPALAAFAARDDVRPLVAKRAPVAPQRRERPDAERELAGRRFPARLAPRRYRTAGELEIWVGRSDAGNDFLTTKLARGRDLFFHLDGAPGSHVILRTEGRSDPPSEAVLDACELAVHFSKQRDATRADVHAVPIANVRKPRGAKPGLVTVHGGKTVHLRRTPERLARVLGDRVED